MTTTTLHGYRAGTWTIDPAHSEIGFSVRHLAISKVRGVFESFEATVTAPEDPGQAAVEATIEVASINTNQSMRDDHLRTSDFFDVATHPRMHFVSTAFHPGADGAFRLEGDLTLKGVTRPVVLTGEIGGVATDARGQVKTGVEATAKINRQAFGVNWTPAKEAGGLTLGDEISLTFDLQFILS